MREEGDPALIALTGAGGRLGRLVLDALLEREPAGRIVVGTRNPGALAAYAARGVRVRRADFDDRGSIARCFEGASRVFLISGDAMPMERRAGQLIEAIDSAVGAGAGFIACTVMSGATGSSGENPSARGQAELRRALASCGVAWAALGMNIWMAGVGYFLEAFRVGDRLLVPEGTGRPRWVAHEDYACVAAAALAGRVQLEGALDITGPEALGLEDLARRWSALHGRPLEPWILPASEVVEKLVAKGMPKQAAEVMASYCPLFRMFEVPITDYVRRVTGREPIAVDALLRSGVSL